MIELKELLARSMFSDVMRLRNWDSAKAWQKGTYLRKATEALRRAGVENVKVKTTVVMTENTNRAKGAQ